MTTGKNKGGRPPKVTSEKRTAEVKFHVTPDVKRRLQNEAIIAGTDLATAGKRFLRGNPHGIFRPRYLPQ